MTDWITTYEAGLRIAAFAAVLCVMLLLETAFPRKDRVQTRSGRWTSNLLIVVLDSLILRLLFPLVAVGVAAFSARQGSGLLNILEMPIWLSFILGLLALDFMIYAQHIAFHKFPVLWSLHKVHHTDRDIDVTTGLRFHPLEILLSMVYKMVVVFALGPSVMVVIVFEILLNGFSMFNHANFALPRRVDRLVRLIFVTPDMHRVHHSVRQNETDSNYGFSLSIWDRLFKTYVAQPKDGHGEMKIGLSEHQDAPASLMWMLTLPFKR